MGMNIVQAEFFHVGGKDTPSLDALLEDCGRRAADGFELALHRGEARSGIKTVVRFIDSDDTLTNIALRAEALERRDREIMKSFQSTSGLRRWWLNTQSRRLARKIILLKDRARAQSVKLLRKAIRLSYHVALERPDRSFRLIRKDEAHELLEAATKARSVWIFVFRPNDLLADKNRMIACAM